MIPRHRVVRPAWTCRTCHQPYPCGPARDRLVAVYGLSPALGRTGMEMLDLAVRELPDAAVTELWDRFVAWTEPVHLDARPGC